MKKIIIFIVLFTIILSGCGGQRSERNETPNAKLFFSAKIKGTDGVIRMDNAIKKGADINAKDSSGWTALMWASFYGNIYGVRYLLQSSANVNLKNNDGNTALILAPKRGDIEIISNLIKAGADVNAKNNKGKTALFSASTWGQIEIVKLLIKAGADVNIKDNSGNTPLTAVQNTKQIDSERRAEITRILREYGSIDLSYDLIEGAKNGDKEKVRLALDKGANINVKDEEGNTALMLVSSRGDIDIFKLLLNTNTDVNINNNQGETALMLAAGRGNIEIVKLLLNANAHVNAKNNSGETALMRAAKNGNIEIVKLLLNANADVNAKNNDSETALHLSSIGYTTIIKLLLEKGADVNIKDKNGNTALDRAYKNKESETIKLLRIASGLPSSNPYESYMMGAGEAVKNCIKLFNNINSENDCTNLNGRKLIIYGDSYGNSLNEANKYLRSNRDTRDEYSNAYNNFVAPLLSQLIEAIKNNYTLTKTYRGTQFMSMYWKNSGFTRRY